MTAASPTRSAPALRSPPREEEARSEGRGAFLFVLLAVALSALAHVVAGMQLSVPWITPDELIYAELAKSIADGSLPSIRGETTFGYGPLYPLIISPAWALFDDPAHAYAAAKAINAVVMSMAGIPAFFLARRFVGPTNAAIVATLSAFIPSVLLSGTLLIEVVLYPVFLLALLGMVASLQEPSRRTQLLAVAGIAVACVAKPLSVVLVPAYVLAIVHVGVLERHSGGTVRERLRRHAAAIGLLGAGGLAAIALSVGGGNPDAVLGIYGVVLGNVDLGGTLQWFVWHLAGLDLYVGVIPFALSLIVIGLSVVGEVGARERVFAAVAFWTIGGTVAAIAAYSSKPLAGAAGYIPSEARLHERNMFVLVPILFVGMALFLERRPLCPRWLQLGCVGLAIVLPLLLPLERLLYNASFQAFVVIPWTAAGIERVWPLTFLPLAGLVALVLLGRARGLATRAWAVVALVLAATTVAAQASMSHPDGGAASTIGIGLDKSWIDRAVPHDSEVTALWVAPAESADAGAGHRMIWMSEFYNRSVGPVIEIGTPMPYELPHLEAFVRDGVVSTGMGRPLVAEFVLAPCWIGVEGRVVASDPRVDAAVYRIPAGPVRISRVEAGGPAPRPCDSMWTP